MLLRTTTSSCPPLAANWLLIGTELNCQQPLAS